MIIHSYVNFEIELENSSGKKLEESGKIMGKDLWVRAHSKENTMSFNLQVIAMFLVPLF